MRRIIALTIAVVMAAPMMALAQQPPGRGDGRPGKMNYINELNLTREQLTQVQELQRQSRKAGVEIKSKIQIKKIDFDAEAQKDKPDPAVLEKLISELADLHARQYRMMLESRVKMLGILTPEQKQKLAEKSVMRMRDRMTGIDEGAGMGQGPESGGMPPPPVE